MSIIVIVNFVFAAMFLGGAVILWRKAQQLSGQSAVAVAEERSSGVLLVLTVPRNNEKTPIAAEQMFAAMHGIFRANSAEQPGISFEMVAKKQSIKFYVYLPSELKNFVISQIYAQYPNIEILEVLPEDDYASLDEGQVLACTELALKKPTTYPIKTFQNFDVDPLSAITGVLSTASATEEMWIQIILRPIDDDWQDMGINEIKLIKEPPKKQETLPQIAKKEAVNITKQFVRAAIPTAFPEEKKEEKKDDKKELPGPVQQAIKGIEDKITKLGFETNIRLCALANDEHTARARLDQLVGSFKQFNTLNTNSFISKEFVNDPTVLELYKNRSIGNPEMIFNITELASLYHFPSDTVTTPAIDWSGSKKGEPPQNLPIVGSVPDQDLTVFAQTNFRSRIEKFGIKKEDRRLHSYIIGRTGTGKSTLLENMIFDDIREGRGVAVIDPHGQLIEHVLKFIPENRLDDVVYFNPADANYPIGFNVLESVNPEHSSIIASGVVGIFKKIFGESWGPRLEYILRNVILALVDYPGSTLLGVNRVLTDNSYRRLVVNSIKDPVVRDFFINEYEKYDAKFRQEAIAPIQNKVGQFLSSNIIRNIVGQPRSSLDIENIMNSGKILLADLSTGKIGEDNSSLLGSMLITKVQLSAMRRVLIPEEERRDFYLYVDEFQNFATDSFATILSEARKYRLNLVMVNQYINQMPETVADAVFGNVGTMISFRVGPRDAESLQNEFAPVFDANDLVNLPNRQIYIKMAVNGVTAPAFSASTLPPPQLGEDYSTQIIENSRQKNALTRDEVEEYIADWSAPISLAQDNAKELIKSAVPAPQLEQKEGSANKTEGAENKPELNNKKIEIIKDRFDRPWYAVANNGGEGAKNEIVKQPPKNNTPQLVRVGESEQNNELITWEKADELGLFVQNKQNTGSNNYSDLDPIDELN